MRALNAAELFDLWEQGWGRLPAQQALLLLGAAWPEEPPDALAGLPIGRRDDRLLALRAQTFGPELRSVAVCPACGERLEFTCPVGDLRSPPSPNTPEPEMHSLSIDGIEIRFRLPAAQDLAAVAAAQSDDPAAARLALLERCLVGSRAVGGEVAPGDLPDKVVSAVVAAMAEGDPQADVQLDLACPACGHGWQAAFDIVSFFWSEIDTWARHVVRDVHTLASAYGWREADILALSPWRRQLYVQISAG